MNPLLLAAIWTLSTLAVFPAEAPPNPVLTGADPHACLVQDTAWMYATNQPDFSLLFAYSSNDLRQWEQHGPILRMDDIAWIREDGAEIHKLWAPCLAEKDGKFLLYFSVGPQDPTPSRIGVAIADNPAGPFQDSGRPLVMGGDGFEAIDPMVFTDSASGTAYLYAGGSAGSTLRVYALTPDMTGITREIPVETPPHFTEAPFMSLRNGIYYLSYSSGIWWVLPPSWLMAAVSSVRSFMLSLKISNRLPLRSLISSTAELGLGRSISAASLQVRPPSWDTERSIQPSVVGSKLPPRRMTHTSSVSVNCTTCACRLPLGERIRFVSVQRRDPGLYRRK